MIAWVLHLCALFVGLSVCPHTPSCVTFTYMVFTIMAMLLRVRRTNSRMPRHACKQCTS